MASAPTPGVGKQLESANVARTIFKLTVRGETKSIAPFNLPLKEDLLLAKATGGMSIESLLGDETHIGLRTIKILWWLARRASGEWQLTLERAWEEWPADLDPESELVVEVDEPDETASDPEA